MSRRDSAQAALRHDYIAIGHVTIDVLADGTPRPGGSALYGALQAARLGLRALIVTCGVPEEIEGLLAPYRGELELEVRPAARTTTLATTGWGRQRAQRILAWAGPLPGPLTPDAAVVHLAPVARELPDGIDLTGAGFAGLTPQGLVRVWPSLGGELSLVQADPGAVALARSCHAVVVSEHEREPCEPVVEAALGAGGLAAITAGSRPVTVLEGAGRAHTLAVAALHDAVDDLGAGDVFAAALFIALARGEAPRAAVRFASAAAAVRMAGHGPDAIGDGAAIAAAGGGGPG